MINFVQETLLNLYIVAKITHVILLLQCLNFFNIKESKHIYINIVNKIYYIEASMFNVVI